MADAAPGPRPEITIGMPVLNGAATIATAIESALAQTFEDFELLICDNASDDATREIAARYAAADRRVRLIPFAERVDVLSSFRRPLQHARAPLFAFLPADDRFYPRYLELTRAELANHPEAVGVAPRVAFLTGRHFEYLSEERAALVSEDLQRNICDYLRDPQENARLFALYRTEALRAGFEVGRYPGEDFHVIARVLARGPLRAVDAVLMERQMTPLETYVAMGERYSPRGLIHRFRFLPLARAIWRDPVIRRSPRLLGALAHLVWLSHLGWARVRAPAYHTRLLPLTRKAGH